MHWVYYFGRVMIRTMVFPFGAWKTKGRENVPRNGSMLIVCNHLHIADPPIVAASFPGKCILMAKEELWQSRWSRFWVENFGALPVKRGGVDREAIRQAEEWLRRGISVVMFPEGKRSPNARMQPALPGAALIAAHTGIPILPVSITGTEKLKKLRLKTLAGCMVHRLHITVTFGTPFNLPPTDGKLSREQRNQLLNTIMLKIAALLPPEYRGVYGGEENAPD